MFVAETATLSMKPNLLSEHKFMLVPNEDSEGEWFEPYFSKSPCECCGSHLGGNRYDCTAIGKDLCLEDISVCPDCVVDFQ